MLYPGSWTELMGFLCSFKCDSVLPKKSKFKLCSVIVVLKVCQCEKEMKKCLSERMIDVCLNFLEEVSLQTILDLGSSITLFSLSNKSSL